MKEKVYSFVGLLCLFVILAGCSSEAKVEYTVEDAKAAGDLVIHNKANRFAQIQDGAVEIFNLEKLASFQKSFDDKKEDELAVTYFTPEGMPIKNMLKTSNGEIIYENNFTGYPGLRKTTYTCKYLSVRNGTVLVEYCKTSDGKQDNALLFVGEEKEIKKAGIHQE